MSKEQKNKLIGIASRFKIQGELVKAYPLGEGFINDTYIVETEGEDPNYLLQRKNHLVFKDVPGMMDNILKVTGHLKKKVIQAGGDPLREAMTIIPTLSGDLYFLDEKGLFWTVSLLIDEHLVFEKADTPALAQAGGEGIGKFQYMLSDFNDTLVDTLPGFHNMRFRFEQWDEVLARDPEGRAGQLEKEIGWIASRREQMMTFWDLIETGAIPARITHNDTKISNILFDKQQKVLCVIDLDTVLNSTVLNDFGDAIRSYANRAAEDEPDLQRIGLDLEMFSAYARGYLSRALPFLSRVEMENLAFSALYITFEQTLRFLMDYIDGDHYYKIAYLEHNLVRARAQNRLLESMESRYQEMQEEIIGLCEGSLRL